jgi:altronate dehydratase small subunit
MPVANGIILITGLEEREVLKKRMLIIDPGDNVGILLADVTKGEIVAFEDTDITAEEAIAFAHKMALCDIPKDADIIKYGEVIGYSLKEIKKGQWVHIHNMDDARGREGRLF